MKERPFIFKKKWKSKLKNVKIINLRFQSVGEQQQPDPYLDICSNGSSNADTKTFTGSTWSKKDTLMFKGVVQVNSFASEGMDMDDSSVQFASSSYGAGSSYGASPQYTQVTHLF